MCGLLLSCSHPSRSWRLCLPSTCLLSTLVLAGWPLARQLDRARVLLQQWLHSTLLFPGVKESQVRRADVVVPAWLLMCVFVSSWSSLMQRMFMQDNVDARLSCIRQTKAAGQLRPVLVPRRFRRARCVATRRCACPKPEKTLVLLYHTPSRHPFVSTPIECSCRVRFVPVARCFAFALVALLALCCVCVVWFLSFFRPIRIPPLLVVLAQLLVREREPAAPAAGDPLGQQPGWTLS